MDAIIHLSYEEGNPLANPTQYRRLVGRLVYLNITRPDITLAIHKLSQFLAHPRTPRLAAAHKVRHYLKSTARQGILFSYSFDSDWGASLDTC